VVEHLGVEPEKVVDNASFRRPRRRQLDTVELVMAFEEEFGLRNSQMMRGDDFDRRRRYKIF